MRSNFYDVDEVSRFTENVNILNETSIFSSIKKIHALYIKSYNMGKNAVF